MLLNSRVNNNPASQGNNAFYQNPLELVSEMNLDRENQI